MNMAETISTSLDAIYILGITFVGLISWLLKVVFARIDEKHKLSVAGDERQEEKRKEDKKEIEAKLEKLEAKIDAYEEIRRLNDTKLYDRVTAVEERITKMEGLDEGYQRGLIEGRRK